MDDGLNHKAATLADAGISVNALWSVYSELSSAALVRVLPEYQLAEETMLWLTYPQSNVLSAKVHVFMDFLLDPIGRRPPWLGK